ncbi:MAG TPA: hypothetical protein GX391_10380 [Firmicutes bacterium]|jgi:hypothetical protein|nr:hypothetical protein [Bacillota bacterium]HOQ24801.1 hypothetical protein [Bacillota bacterium]
MSVEKIREEIEELRRQLDECTIAAKEMALMKKIRQLEQQLEKEQK